MTEQPDFWANLTPGGVDARRVDPDGRYDFFWVVNGKGEPGLLLRVPAGTPEPKPLPRMRSLDLALRDVTGGRSLVLMLRDAEQRELFRSLCLDIVRAADLAEGSADALQRTIQRTLRWHHLLRGGKSDALSVEEQRGLIGELSFLERLAALTGWFAAIETWKGPAGASKDFEAGRCLVEIKARRGAAKPSVQISSEDQLADVDGCQLFLTVVAVDAAIKPQGRTLTDYVTELDRRFAEAEPEAYALWEQALADVGFDFEHDYSDRRWNIGRAIDHEVKDGFPRIVPPLGTGVASVRYSISLDACAPYVFEPEALDRKLAEEIGHG